MFHHFAISLHHDFFMSNIDIFPHWRRPCVLQASVPVMSSFATTTVITITTLSYLFYDGRHRFRAPLKAFAAFTARFEARGCQRSAVQMLTSLTLLTVSVLRPTPSPLVGTPSPLRLFRSSRQAPLVFAFRRQDFRSSPIYCQ